MELVWTVYFIDTVLAFANGLFDVMGGLMVFVIIFGIPAVILSGILEREEGRVELRRLIKLVGIPFLSIWALLGLVPEKETAYKMLAVYGATEFAQIEEVQKIGGKSLEVINKVMDDYLDKKQEQ